MCIHTRILIFIKPTGTQNVIPYVSFTLTKNLATWDLTPVPLFRVESPSSDLHFTPT